MFKRISTLFMAAVMMMSITAQTAFAFTVIDFAPQVTATSDANSIKLTWPELPGKGTAFEGYVVLRQKGKITGNLESSAGKSYINQNYFNWISLNPVDMWSFQVATYKKNPTTAEYEEVSTRSPVINISTKGLMPQLAIAATSKGKNSVHLEWAQGEGFGVDFDKYLLVWKKGSSDAYMTSPEGAKYLTTNSFTVTGLESGTQYTFAVTPIATEGNTMREVATRSKITETTQSEVISGPDVDLNLGPVSLSVTSKVGGVSLQWADLAGMGTKFDKYRISWKEGYYASFVEGMDTANSYVSYNYYNLSGLKEDTWYSFQIVPVKWYNGTYVLAGAKTGVFKMKTGKTEPEPKSETLATPNITSPAAGATLKNMPRKAYISWTWVNGATAYAIEVACDTCGSTNWGSVEKYVTENTWINTNPLAGDNGFRVRVRAENHNTNAVGEWSEYRYFNYKTAVDSNPAPQNNDQDSMTLKITGWANGLPAIQWSNYTDKYFDGYAVFVREGSWDKNKATWTEPFYLPKTQTAHQLAKMKENTIYTVRVIPYLEKAAGREMLYPASNVIVFKTGAYENTPPTQPQNPQPSYSCAPDTIDDGEMKVCKGDVMEHDKSGLEIKVKKFTKNYIKLELDAADKKTIIVKFGQTKVVKSDSDVQVAIKYTQWNKVNGVLQPTIKINSWE